MPEATALIEEIGGGLPAVVIVVLLLALAFMFRLYQAEVKGRAADNAKAAERLLSMAASHSDENLKNFQALTSTVQAIKEMAG